MQVLFSVTVRDAVEAAPPLIANELTDGANPVMFTLVEANPIIPSRSRTRKVIV